jgi:hypothetical protein
LIRDVFEAMARNDYYDLSKIEEASILDLDNFSKGLESDEDRRALRSVVLFLRSKRQENKPETAESSAPAPNTTGPTSDRFAVSQNVQVSDSGTENSE